MRTGWSRLGEALGSAGGIQPNSVRCARIVSCGPPDCSPADATQQAVTERPKYAENGEQTFEFSLATLPRTSMHNRIALYSLSLPNWTFRWTSCQGLTYPDDRTPAFTACPNGQSSGRLTSDN